MNGTIELLSKLPIEGKKVVANAMLVSEGRPYSKYVEGVKTGIAGTAYNVLLPALDYLNVPVKIEGEMTPSIEYSGTPIPVIFSDVYCKAYRDFGKSGEIKLSITAKGIQVLDRNRLKVNRGTDDEK